MNNSVIQPALTNAKEIAELTSGDFNRALRLYMSKRGFKFKLSKPPANDKGEPLYGIHRVYPSRNKPLAKMSLEGWRKWFTDGGNLEDFHQR